MTAIAPDAMAARLTEPAAPTVIDVRTPAEYETAHVPGSLNVPLNADSQRGLQSLVKLLEDDVLTVKINALHRRGLRGNEEAMKQVIEQLINEVRGKILADPGRHLRKLTKKTGAVDDGAGSDRSSDVNQAIKNILTSRAKSNALCGSRGRKPHPQSFQS